MCSVLAVICYSHVLVHLHVIVIEKKKEKKKVLYLERHEYEQESGKRRKRRAKASVVKLECEQVSRPAMPSVVLASSRKDSPDSGQSIIDVSTPSKKIPAQVQRPIRDGV